jgi:hypothetical protein
MFETYAKVGLKSTQIPTDLIFTLKSEGDLEKDLGYGVDIENINEKHEKNYGSDKDSAKQLFCDEDENDRIKLRIESISSNRSNAAENLNVQANKICLKNVFFLEKKEKMLK